MAVPGEYYKCRGCGGVIIFFMKEAPPGYPVPSIGHGKPVALIGKPNSVFCSLYRDTNTVRAMHRVYNDHVKHGEKMPQPTEFKPYAGN